MRWRALSRMSRTWLTQNDRAAARNGIADVGRACGFGFERESVMTPDEIAEMQADALAGTPGEWAWNEIDPSDPDWGACEVWAGDDVVSSNTFGPANARRIARVPRMEAAVTALTAELATLQAMNAKLFADFNIHAAELAAERQARARYQDKCEGMAEQAEADQIKIEAQAAEIARLKAVMGQMQEGWANALELDLIPERHRASATILRDTARAALVQP